MTLVPVAPGARLLGIHPKTLRHWLTAAAFPLAAHPSDARLTCVAEEHLLALATQHGRPLSALAPLLMPKSDAASAFAAAHLNPLPAPEGEPAQQAAVLCAPSASLADLLQQLSQLHLQLATLQHCLTGLTLAVLHERTGLDEDLLQQRLRPRAGSVPQSHESLLASSQADGTGLPVPSPLPAPRPLPAEVRARSRVTALIEYGAHGQYVAVCPKLGVLSLTPDSPQWFDWLASLTSFRGCRAQPGALRRVVPPPTGSTPAVGLPGACFMGTTAGTILGSPTVSHAPLWNRRRLSFKLGWTRSE